MSNLFHIVNVDEVEWPVQIEEGADYVLITGTNIFFTPEYTMESWIASIRRMEEAFPAAGIFYGDHLVGYEGTTMYAALPSYEHALLQQVKDVMEVTGPLIAIRANLMVGRSYDSVNHMVREVVERSHGVHIPAPSYVVVHKG